MCILTLALDAAPDFPLILCHNRDEYYGRETTGVEKRADGLVCATDVSGGGTWLGLNPCDGGLAALTNVRCRPQADVAVRSRGELVSRVLLGDAEAAASQSYAGFHLWHCRLRADGTRSALRQSVSSPGVDDWQPRTSTLAGGPSVAVKSNDHGERMTRADSDPSDGCTWAKAAWLQAEVERILRDGAVGAAGEAGARAIVAALAPALSATTLPAPYSARAALAEPTEWSALSTEHERALHAAPFVAPLELGGSSQGTYGTVSQTVVLHCMSEGCAWYAYRETAGPTGAAVEWTWRRVELPAAAKESHSVQ